MRLCQIIQTIWEKPHLNWRSFCDLLSCIKMSCHHACALHLLYSLYLLCSFRCCCVSVDQGVEVQPSSSTNLYYFHSNKASVIPLLCAFSWPMFPPNIFTHNIAFDSNVFWVELEYPTNCINSYTISCSLPIIHRIDVLTWVKLYMLYTYA